MNSVTWRLWSIHLHCFVTMNTCKMPSIGGCVGWGVIAVIEVTNSSSSSSCDIKGTYDTNKNNACTKLWLKKGSYASHLSHKLTIGSFCKTPLLIYPKAVICTLLFSGFALLLIHLLAWSTLDTVFHSFILSVIFL